MSVMSIVYKNQGVPAANENDHRLWFQILRKWVPIDVK